jgi:signal transduction histidine kinase
MSHELRTPLTAILGFSELLGRDQQLSEAQQASITMINRSGTHLLTLINNVLDLAKIEASKLILQAVPCDLHRLLQDVAALFGPATATKQLDFELTIAPQVPRSVEVDEVKLRQVLINLLSNAVKFTDRGKVQLAVACGTNSADVAQLAFTVQDTGKGIAADELDQLFEAFVQTAAGRASQQGTGLGLSISRQLVGLMGGDLGVESQPQVGTVFRFQLVLPIVDQLPIAPATTAPTVRTAAPIDPRSQLAQQPPDWCQALHAAAMDLNSDSSLALVKQLPSEFGELGRSLVDLIENYRFDLLMEMLDQT